MIGKLKGHVDSLYKDTLIVLVGGVGYRVSVPTRTLVRYGRTNKDVELAIHTFVREDQLALYGFETTEELSLFEKLISVSGIGPRLGLAVLSAGSPEEIAQAVLNADVTFFDRISGIGLKSARRLVVELRDIVGTGAALDLALVQTPLISEAVQALRQFGFTEKEAHEAIHEIKDATSLTSEELVRSALKQLGK